jgi:hypothetical protein
MDADCLRWLRSKKRFWTCWALIGLALQLASTFGHALHLNHAERTAAPMTAPGKARSAASHIPAIPAGRALDCEICTAASLIGNGLPAVAPEPELPTLAYRLRFRLPAARAAAIPLRVTFQARAPPAC